MARPGARDHDAGVLRFFAGRKSQDLGAALGDERSRSENAGEPRTGKIAEMLRRTWGHPIGHRPWLQPLPPIPFKPRQWGWRLPSAETVGFHRARGDGPKLDEVLWRELDFITASQQACQ